MSKSSALVVEMPKQEESKEKKWRKFLLLGDQEFAKLKNFGGVVDPNRARLFHKIAILYNAAYEQCDDQNESETIARLSKLERFLLGDREDVTDVYAEKFHARRAQRQSFLDNCQTQLNGISLPTQDIDKKWCDNVAQVYSGINGELKDYIAGLLEESREELKQKGVEMPISSEKYSIISLGSLARKEATPYSDLEFAIILDDDLSDKTIVSAKDYFRKLSVLLSLKVSNLGESLIPQSWYQRNFDEGFGLKAGLQFDQGGKTPLGREDEDYDLIGKVSTLANYVKEEPAMRRKDVMNARSKWLPIELCNFDHLTGNPLLTDHLKSEISGFLRSDAKVRESAYANDIHARAITGEQSLMRLSEGKLRSRLVMMGDMKYLLDSLVSEERLIDVKKDLYRLPDRVMDSLSLYHHDDAQTLIGSGIDKIEELRVQKKFNKNDEKLNEEVAFKITRGLAIAMYFRLKIHLEGRGGLDIWKVDVQEEELMRQYYKDIIPFYQNMVRFSLLGTRAEEERFNHDPAMVGDKSLIDGLVEMRLGKYENAKTNFGSFIEKNWKASCTKAQKSDLAQTYFNLGLCNLKLTKFDEAIACFLASGQEFDELFGRNYSYEQVEVRKRAAGIYTSYTVTGDKDYYVGAEKFYNEAILLLPKTSLAEEQKLLEKKWLLERLKELFVEKDESKTHHYQQEIANVERELMPKSFFNLPTVIGNFTGREEISKDIIQKLGANENILITDGRHTLIAGDGGIGKTELSIAIGNQVREKYNDNVRFLLAENEASLKISLVKISEIFGIKGTDEKNVKDLSEEIAKKILRGSSGDRYLFIMDNVDELEVFESFLLGVEAARDKIDIICTTRRNDICDKICDAFPETFAVEPLDNFTCDQAKKFVISELEATFKRRKIAIEEDDVKLLTELLECHPLTLRQATSYLKQWSAITIQDYCKKVKDFDENSSLNDYLVEGGVEPIQVEGTRASKSVGDLKTVRNVWEITLKRLEEEATKKQSYQDACDIFNYVSYLSPDEIDKEIFYKIPSVAEKDDVETRVNKAFSILLDNSLIESVHKPGKQRYKIHRLTQSTNRVRIAKSEDHGKKEGCLNQVALLLTQEANLHDFIRNGGFSHCLETQKHFEKMGSQSAEYARLLYRIGRIYDIQAEYEKAAEVLEKSISIKQDDARSAMSKAELGRVLYHQGKYPAAATHTEEALKIAPNNHRIVSYLSEIYFNQGKYQESQNMSERGLQIALQNPRENQLEIAWSKEDMGWFYYRQGQYDLSFDNFEQSCNIRKKKLGDNSLSVAWSLNGMACVHLELGDYSKALKDFNECLEIRKNILGEDHPNVSWSIKDVGNVYYHQGKYAEAVTEFNKALKIDEKLEEDHPNIISLKYVIARTKLSMIYFSEDKKDLAEVLSTQESVLEKRRKTQQENHPHIAFSLNEVARAYCVKGDYETAMKRYDEAFGILKTEVGGNYQAAIITLVGIGEIFTRQEKYDKAIGKFKEAEDIAKTLKLNSDNPDIALISFAKGQALVGSGELEEAQAEYKKAYDIRRSKIPQHPVTDKTLKELNELEKEIEHKKKSTTPSTTPKPLEVEGGHKSRKDKKQCSLM